MTDHLTDTNVGNIEYIRRQDAKDALQAKVFHNLTDEFYGAMQVLDELEPADVVQVVHAYWIQTSAEDEDGNAYYSCSNCGSGESHNPIVEVPYCWKCGAKMDVGK